MTMLNRAVAFMADYEALHEGTMLASKAFTLTELRKAAGIALRSQYRLSEQLKADSRVRHIGSNAFILIWER
jgi:hypothetical protein